MATTISINRAPVLTLWAAGERERGEEFWVELCGRAVPAKNTADGIRAVKDRAVVTAESAEAYLEAKFGDNLAEARAAMTTLARAYPPRELAAAAFELYETFRPAVPEGVKGWGAKGVLDLRKVRSLAKG
jgi:hypothetical protein